MLCLDVMLLIISRGLLHAKIKQMMPNKALLLTDQSQFWDSLRQLHGDVIFQQSNRTVQGGRTLQCLTVIARERDA